MDLTQLYIFGMENSQEPVIKNPILRAALEGPSITAQEPRMGYAGGRLVNTGPNTGKYFYWIGKGDNYRSHYADSPTDGETWVTQNRKKKGWTKKQGGKITMTEKNKGAQHMFKKNYNELSAGEQKKVYDNIYDTFKTKTDKPGKFKGD